MLEIFGTEGDMLYWQALGAKTFRDLKAIGKKFYGPKENPRIFARREAQFKQLEGDLIENLPKPKFKQERRQNLIHGDLDPSNSLFIYRTLLNNKS